MSSTSRMLSLLSLLQARRDWPGDLLAERLEVSARTVRRDVDRLRGLGYRIRAIKGPDGGYRLDAGAELPPLLFDDEQAVAIAVALQNATAAGAGVEEAAVRALTTVRQVLPARLRHRLDSLRFTTLEPRVPDAAPTDPAVLIALSSAVRAREVLRFDYARPGAEPDAPVRRVEPHHLVASAGRWYLVAWDLERDDWRVFRADRIAPRTPTGPRFRARPLPGGDVRAFVTDRFTGATTGDSATEGAGRPRWPCRGSAVIGRAAGEVHPFAEGGSVIELGGGRCRVEAGSWSWMALAAWFARFDAPLTEVEPAELRAGFATLAHRATVAADER